jgi:hypothetical protein
LKPEADVEVCPICGTKSCLGVYLCVKCWSDFMHYCEKNYSNGIGSNDEEILAHLSEYLDKKAKEWVLFT